MSAIILFFFFFQAEDGIRDWSVTGVQTCALPIFEALGAKPPEFVHHGLILGEDGKKLAKRAPGATVGSLREAGIPAEAVRRYLEELGIPKHDVHYDLPRIRRLAIEAIGALPDDELAARVGAPR